MPERKPFFELFSDFSPDFSLRHLLSGAVVTNMVLEAEKRTLTLELEAASDFPDAARTAIEQLLAQRYELHAVDLRVQAAPPSPKSGKDTKKKTGKRPKHIMGHEIKGKITPIRDLSATMGHVVVEGKVFKADSHETRRPGMWTIVIEMTIVHIPARSLCAAICVSRISSL